MGSFGAQHVDPGEACGIISADEGSFEYSIKYNILLPNGNEMRLRVKGLLEARLNAQNDSPEEPEP